MTSRQGTVDRCESALDSRHARHDIPKMVTTTRRDRLHCESGYNSTSLLNSRKELTKARYSLVANGAAMSHL